MKNNNRYRVMQPITRDNQDKTFWNRIGTAFKNPGKNGAPPSISVKLDSLPLGGEVVLFEDDGQDAPAAE